jgi:hypothetical protein
MVTKKVEVTKECCEGKCMGHHGSSNNSGSAVYVIGMFGAIVYFFQHASNFSDYAMAIVNSLAWPAILVFKAFELLKF